MTASPSPSPAPPTIVFLDVDGTLVNYELEVPDSAADAVRQARSRGHRVVLTTGRSKAEMPENIWGIGFDGLIGGNGMYLEYDGGVLADRALEADLTAELVDWLRERGRGFYLESRNGLFADSRLVGQGAARFYGEDSAANRERFAGMLHDLVVTEELHRSDVAKLSFVLGDDVAGLLAQAHERFGDRVKISTWSGTGNGPEFGEFALPGIDKLVAVRELLGELERREPGLAWRTVAVGDAASDAAMVTFADVGVAMGNGEDELKAVADLVAPGVDDGGLARAFAELGLVGEAPTS